MTGSSERHQEFESPDINFPCSLSLSFLIKSDSVKSVRKAFHLGEADLTSLTKILCWGLSSQCQPECSDTMAERLLSHRIITWLSGVDFFATGRGRSVCSLICMDEKICRKENPVYSLSVKVYSDLQFIFNICLVNWTVCNKFKQKTPKTMKLLNLNLSLRIFLCPVYLLYALQQGPSKSGL